MTATRQQARAAVARLAAAPVPLVDPGFVARVAQQLGDLDLDELTVELVSIDGPRRRPARPVGGPRRPRVGVGGSWLPSRTGWTLGGLGLVMATVVAAVALGGAKTSTTVRVNDPGVNETIAPTTSTAATTEVTAPRPTTVPATVTVTTASDPTPTPSPVPAPADPGAVSDPTATGPSTTPATTPASSTPSSGAEPSIAPAVAPATRPTSAPAPTATTVTSAPTPTSPTTVATSTESTTPATMTLTCTSKVVTGQPVVICEWSEVAGAATYALLKGPNGRVLSPNPGYRRVEDHDVVLGSTYTYVVWARDAAGRNLAHSPLVTVACCTA